MRQARQDGQAVHCSARRGEVLGHDIGDLGLHMRLGASRIRLPGRQQLDDVKALQTA